jgi:hypothetical protein
MRCSPDKMFLTTRIKHTLLMSIFPLHYSRNKIIWSIYQTVLRCRIGHTKITHSYLLTNDNAAFCVACNENFTVKHFLLECHDFSQARNRFYCVNSLKELLNTIPSKNIIDNLKEINLYSRI